MLKIENLSKKFGEKLILNGVDVTMKSSSVNIFLGSSGVGKSTLLRILAGLEMQDKGTITLNEQLLDPKTVLQKHIVGMVFQNFNLFPHMTVLQNISFALEKVLGFNAKTAEQLAFDLLKKYNLLDKARASIASLSGGQKQRLAIARAVALKPQIICMDEPTSALDPLLTAHIADIIAELAHQGYTVIIATHDTFLLEKLLATIHLMHNGKIIESVHSSDYQQNPEHYHELNAFIKGHTPKIDSENC